MQAYDIVVVGGGSAGAATALAAADEGATVLLVEKTDELGGTSRWSAGNLWNVSGPESLEHLRALSFGTTPDAVLTAYRDGLNGLRGWLAAHGAPTTDVPPHILPPCWPNFPGADGVEYFAVPGDHGSGPALWEALAAALAGPRGAGAIEVRSGTAMSELTTDDSGRVTGVELRDGSGAVSTVEATRGVVLATGGFEGDPRLVASYLPLSPLETFAPPGNTGDGLRVSQQVGASVWHMSTFFGFWGFRTPDFPIAFPVLLLGHSHLIVDSDGRRFHAEFGHEAHDAMRPLQEYLPGRPNHPHLPAFAIFDETMLGDLPLVLFPSANGYRWSPDNAAELERGWIVAADSAEELAGLIGVPARQLTDTLARYADIAELGRDDDFGRPADTLRPLAPGRLFAIRLSPGVATTSGGPRRDEFSRVLRHDDSPIPGLYAVGGTGGVWGALTQHGGGLTDGLVFGPIAARHALGA